VQPVALMLGHRQGAGVLKFHVLCSVLRQFLHRLGSDLLQDADEVGDQQLERRHPGD
jgi:hypothetical protein